MLHHGVSPAQARKQFELPGPGPARTRKQSVLHGAGHVAQAGPSPSFWVGPAPCRALTQRHRQGDAPERPETTQEGRTRDSPGSTATRVARVVARRASTPQAGLAPVPAVERIYFLFAPKLFLCFFLQFPPLSVFFFFEVF